MNSNLWLAGFLMAGLAVFAQTQVDLKNQAKDIDFSTASRTVPAKTGPALPSACGVGEMFFSTTAPIGANLFVCGSNNSWTHSGEPIPSTTLSGLPAVCSVGDMTYVTDASFASGGWRLYSCSPANTWTQAGLVADGTGYITVTCPAPSNCVVGPNTAVLPTLPGPNTWTGAHDYSGASKTAMFRVSATAPATCDATSHEAYLNTSTNMVGVCTSANTWTNLGPQRSFLLYRNTGLMAVTASGSTQTLDSFVIPAGTLQVGDVVEIEAVLTRTGSAAPISFGITFGGSSNAFSIPASTSAAVFKPTLTVAATSSQVWGGVFLPNGGNASVVSSSAAAAAIASGITVSLTQDGTAPDTGAVTSWFVKVIR
nr:hypothetical protein [uncultured bacterium]